VVLRTRIRDKRLTWKDELPASGRKTKNFLRWREPVIGHRMTTPELALLLAHTTIAAAET